MVTDGTRMNSNHPKSWSIIYHARFIIGLLE
jgi:hypothetical protein